MSFKALSRTGSKVPLPLYFIYMYALGDFASISSNLSGYVFQVNNLPSPKEILVTKCASTSWDCHNLELKGMLSYFLLLILEIKMGPRNLN